MRTGYGCCLLEISPEEYKRRRISFALGLVLDTAITGLVLAAGVWFPYHMAEANASHHISQYAMITLPSPPEPKPILKTPPQPKAIPRTIALPKFPTPEIRPAPHVEPREEPPVQVKLPVPKLEIKQQPVEIAAARPQPAPGPLRPAPAIHTGLFGRVAAHAESDHTPLNRVQTGGFGSPEGLPGEAKGGNPGNVPKLGSFDLPVGPGQGNGTGGAQGSARIVATGGFGVGGVGNGEGPGPGSGTSGGVKTGAFTAASEPAPVPAKPARAETPRPQTQPVEILSKPSPQYTEEARRLRVQGEVVLSVVFQANGTLKIVGVVKSLGHGLDQMAELAASQIRFKPAEQDGRPMDFPATLRIEFRLA